MNGIQFKGKYRGNSKIKHKHRMIEGLREYLESIQNNDCIDSITPSEIKRSKSQGKFEFKVQYNLGNSLRCIAKSKNGEVQEVFIVGKNLESIIDSIRTK